MGCKIRPTKESVIIMDGSTPPRLRTVASRDSQPSIMFSSCGAITPSLMVVGVWSIDIFSSPIPSQNNRLYLDPPTLFSTFISGSIHT